jgi:hypothetical protein
MALFGCSSKSAVPTIYCPSMTTGLLCSHGTRDALEVRGDASERWVTAVRAYNRAVASATQQLQAEAKEILTPAQMTEVERWFAVGLNPQMNQLLLQAPGAQDD